MSSVRKINAPGLIGAFLDMMLAERNAAPNTRAAYARDLTDISGFLARKKIDLPDASEDDLRGGKFFSIIELNGAAAEATSIYDARNSVWTAYRTLFQQWSLIFAIGAENRRRGCTTTKPIQLWLAWRNYAKISATYPAAD